MNKIQQKIEQGREYRDMKLTARLIDEDEKMIVEGYATTFDEPYDLYWLDENTVVKEVVERKAFENTDLSDVIFQYDHEGRVFARLSNDTMKLDIDDHGLKVTADLGGTEIGRNLYEEISKGYTNKMSFGFIVGEDEVTEREEDGKTIYTRYIQRVDKVFDVSAVSLPANNNTEIVSARKHLDGVIEGLIEEHNKREEAKRMKELKVKQLRARIKVMKGV